MHFMGLLGLPAYPQEGRQALVGLAGHLHWMLISSPQAEAAAPLGDTNKQQQMGAAQVQVLEHLSEPQLSLQGPQLSAPCSRDVTGITVARLGKADRSQPS